MLGNRPLVLTPCRFACRTDLPRGLMVVCDLDVVGIPILPMEADPILIVDPDAQLAGAISPEMFQPIAGRDSQVSETGGPVDQVELPGR